LLTQEWGTEFLDKVIFIPSPLGLRLFRQLVHLGRLPDKYFFAQAGLSAIAELTAKKLAMANIASSVIFLTMIVLCN
jgi:hypothetical protein